MNQLPPPVRRPTRSAAALRHRTIAALVVIPITACGPASDDPPEAVSNRDTTSATDASVVPPATPEATDSQATVVEEPSRGSVSFGGPEAMEATVFMPAGSSAEGWYVGKRASEPSIGLAFFDVANIYSDPCQWVQIPPVGPTVDDLGAAFQESTVFDVTPVSDVTVDGFPGKYIEVTVPDYDEAECREFGLFKEDGETDARPDFWAQAPHQTLEMWILDVDGTRLVVSAGYYPDTSEQDRQALTDMVASLDIH